MTLKKGGRSSPGSNHPESRVGEQNAEHIRDVEF